MTKPTKKKRRVTKELLAKRIVKGIHKDLLDRRFLKHFFDKNYGPDVMICCDSGRSLDPEIIDEILSTWKKIALEELSK